MSRFARRYTQLIAAVLYNCNFKGFINGRIYKGETKGVCTPGLNCYSCPGAVFACPLGSLQGAISKSVYKFPLYMLGTILLFGILFGRMICGFLCPFGLVQELIYKRCEKLPLPKLTKGRVTRTLSWLKYGIFMVFVIAIPLAKGVPGFCKFICPAGTLEAGIPLVMLDEYLQKQIGHMFSWKVITLILCVLLCMLCYRAFCRFLCPLGALYSFFNAVSFFGITVEKEKCIGCNACVRMCKMDTRKVGDRECIHCGECREVCPKNAILYKGCHSKRKK